MSDTQTDGQRPKWALRGYPPKGLEARALGLWEGLSHSASLRSIVIVLKSHSALLRSIVIVLKVVAAKTNWRGKNVKYEFNITSLLPNQKYEFKIVLVYYLHQKLVSNSTSLNVCPSSLSVR